MTRVPVTRVPASPVRDAVVGYADRWHRTLPVAHRVTSPLGAWLVLALAAPSTDGADREAVETALGTDAASAEAAAGALLAQLPPAIAAAAAFWSRPGVVERTWPPGVATGPVPSQPAADAWAREHTLGLITSFPLHLTPQTLFVLCSAVATRVRWPRPFDVSPAFGDWAVPTLASAGGPTGAGQVVTTRVGEVGVWTASSEDGLDVTSVVAERSVPAADVLAVAHEIAVAVTTDPGHTPGHRSLFDLPLGPTDRWEVSESVAHGARSERVTARLPAWQASTDLDLLADPRTGFAAAGRGLASAFGGADLAAVQTALARFGREGFEAAAVTAMAGRAAAMMSENPQRHAELRFAHPYAVVATAGGWRQEDLRSPWFGLPVFAAWVAEAAHPAAVVVG